MRPVEAARIIARRVDVFFPGDHVVEAGSHAGVSGPQDAVFRGPEAARLRPFVAIRAIWAWPRVSAARNAVSMPTPLEDASSQQLAEAAAGPVLQDVAQDTKVLIAVGIIASPGRTAACGRRRSPAPPPPRRTALRPASRAASPRPSSRAVRTGCGTDAAHSARLRPVAADRRAHRHRARTGRQRRRATASR